MKIAVVSPNSASLHDINRILATEDGAWTVALHEGGAAQVRVVADQQHPHLIILDSMCRDLDDLRVVDYVSMQHPHTAIVMLCSNQNPDFLMHAMRAGVREVLHSPASKETLLACVHRVEQRLGLSAHPKHAGKVFAFVPCKGGSGSTFLATNLGYQLASENKRVLLIDLNLQFGDAALFVHDHKPSHTLADVAQHIARLDASFLSGTLVNVSPNYGLLAAPEDPAHAMEVKPDHIEILLNLAINQYDYVIVDAARTLDAVTVKALDRANFIFPVIQLTLPFVRDASRLLTSFHSLGYEKEKLRLLINRFEKGGELGVDEVRRTLGLDVYKTIPNSYNAVAAAVNQGRPIASFARSNPVTKALNEMVQALARPPQEEAALLARLLRRNS